MNKPGMLFISLLCSVVPVFTQEDVTFQLMEPAGPEVKLDESLKAIITNNAQEPLTVYLQGYVQEAEDGEIVRITSHVFTVQPGVTTLNKRNLDDLQPTREFNISPEYEEYGIRTHKFPPGEYEFCGRLYLAEEGSLLAEDCYEKTIEEYLSPSLIAPETGATVMKSQPLFTWSPVPGSNAGDINYTFQVVEMEGNQSPTAAFESNPLWFERTGITSPLFQYPVSARTFEKKQQYAWQVIAKSNEYTIGKSEIWHFTYNPDKDTTQQEKEEEKQADALETEQFVNLQRYFSSGYYLLDDYELRFVYNNSYARSSLKCDLQTTENEIVAENILKKEQAPGINFNRLDITNHVEPDKIYKFRCTDPTGDAKGMRFKVRKEKTENTIEELNLDKNLLQFEEGLFQKGGGL